MASAWLNTMIARGDSVAIDHGRLVVQLASGGAFDHHKFGNPLLTEICQLMGVNAYHYQSYNTGKYSGGRISGLTLQFENALTGEPAYCCFNTELAYQRNGKYGKQGEPLPKKQFYVKTRTQFYKLWEACQLPKPHSNSRYFEAMGKLKAIVFTGNITKGEKLGNDTLAPLSISHELIEKALNADNSPHKKHIRNTQVPHKEHIRNT